MERTSKPLTILAVTSELPWPLDTGGHLRAFHLLSALARRSTVRLLTGAHQGETGAALAEAGVEVAVLHDDRRTPQSEASRLLAATMRAEPYVMYRRHFWRSVRDRLRDEIERRPPDVLYLDHLDSFLYAPLAQSCAIVADLHNVYSLLAARTADEQPRALQRLFLKHEAHRLARMEREAARRADLVMAVSAEESQYYRRAGAITELVPNGVDCSRYAGLPERQMSDAPTILYIGSMSWRPNATAAQFLAQEVLPRVRSAIPRARLRIVGRDPTPEVLQLAQQDGVEVTGRVDDVRPYLRDANVLAVPLESGGGTRLKILEAFAAGLPVVSTPVGAEGIEVRPGVHCAISPRADFADTLTGLLLDATGARAMAVAARRLVRGTYDWQIIGAKALAAIEAAVRRRHPAYRREYRHAG